MSGRNRFEFKEHPFITEAKRRAASAGQPAERAVSSSSCVFISHKSEDKEMARVVAKALLEMGIDIYFDERDPVLQAAWAEENDAAIVKCINDGLDNSTHLLGLITKNTFKSWWVPYEMGGAKGREKTCGHLVASDVTELPSYVKIAPLLLDIDDLIKWVLKIGPVSKEMTKAEMTSQTKALIKSYVPDIRSSAAIAFY